MPKLIKDGRIVEDVYQVVNEKEDGSLALAQGPVLVKLALWQKHRAELLAYPHPKGVQLASDEFAEAIVEDLPALDLVAVDFPAFADGRGYSTAALLRSRYGFTGELRATGDVIKDTVFYQLRCGFNSFAVRPDKNLEDALLGLTTFSVRYQGACDAPPLYRSRSVQA